VTDGGRPDTEKTGAGRRAENAAVDADAKKSGAQF